LSIPENGRPAYIAASFVIVLILVSAVSFWILEYALKVANAFSWSISTGFLFVLPRFAALFVWPKHEK